MGKLKEIYDFKKEPDENDSFLQAGINNGCDLNSAVLVALELPHHRRWQILESLEELKALTESVGLIVQTHFINKRDEPSASYFIGSGTLTKLKEYCDIYGVKILIFDDDLSPAQVKNIMRFLDNSVRVIDRTELILDIFARRARTKEGKLQVELAQLEYMLPRLTRQWIHLTHQEGVTGGVVGVRGPGERQIEMDRRQIRHRIHSIKKELKTVERYRSVQRKQRQRRDVPVMAIIGYTNAGKSTLFNAITDSHVVVRDKLFATLDPTTRRFVLPNNQDVLLIDTVGFIRKLPHQLVDAFKATLEEVRQADILIHVLDVSDDKADDRKKAVYKVLKELESDTKTTVTVLNKIDIMPNNSALSRMEEENHPCVALSAKTGEGISQFYQLLMNEMLEKRIHAKLLIPFNEQALLSRLYTKGQVLVRKDQEDGIYIEAEYEKPLEHIFETYKVDGKTGEK